MATATTYGTGLYYFDEALRIDYLPVVRKQLENSTYLMSKLRKNEKDVVGKSWQMVAHYQRNSGVGAGTESGLPTAGRQLYKNPSGDVKFNRGRIRVTGPAIEASKNDKGAIIRALQSEIEGVTRDLEKDINYQLHNDGTAARALINGDPGTGTTLTLDHPGTNYLNDGMLIDIVDPSSGVPCTSSTDLTVTSVNSTTEVTLSAAANADVADNDVVVRANSTNDTGTSYEMMGIKGIIDDGTYVVTLHNLSRTSYAWWKASTHANDDNSGTNRDMTLPLIQASFTAVEKKGGKVGLILSDFDTRDAYAALVIADKRFVNTLDLDGGFKGLDYNGVGWVADVDCMPNTVYFIDLAHLEIMQMSSWSWMDRDGSVLSRVSDADAYEAVLFWYADLTSDKPSAHSFLRDVQ